MVATAAAAVSAQIDSKMLVTETIDAQQTLSASDPTLIHEIKTLSNSAPITLSALTTPPAIDAWKGSLTLTGGTDTLDLRALLNAGAIDDKDFNGLKLSCYKFAARSNNTGTCVIKPGAVNPHDFGGDANAQITLGPGEVEMRISNNGSLEDIDATHKTIDFIGTANDVIDVLLVAG